MNNRLPQRFPINQGQRPQQPQQQQPINVIDEMRKAVQQQMLAGKRRRSYWLPVERLSMPLWAVETLLPTTYPQWLPSLFESA